MTPILLFPCCRCAPSCSFSPLGVAFLALSACLLAGCASNPAKRPSLAPVQEQVALRDFAGTTLDFNLVIHNPSDRGFAVQGYTYEFHVAGRKFKNDRVATKSNVPAGEQWQRTLSMVLRQGELDAFLGRRRRGEASLPYELRGAVHMVDRSGNRKLPFQVRGEIRLLRKPQFSLETIRVNTLSDQRATLQMELVAENPNPFPLRFSNATLDLILDGQSFTQQKSIALTALEAGQTIRLPLTVEARLDLLGEPARRILQKRAVGYRLTGRAVFTTPWDEKKISFERGGIAELRPLF